MCLIGYSRVRLLNVCVYVCVKSQVKIFLNDGSFNKHFTCCFFFFFFFFFFCTHFVCVCVCDKIQLSWFCQTDIVFISASRQGHTHQYRGEIYISFVTRQCYLELNPYELWCDWFSLTWFEILVCSPLMYDLSKNDLLLWKECVWFCVYVCVFWSKYYLRGYVCSLHFGKKLSASPLLRMFHTMFVSDCSCIHFLYPSIICLREK